MCRVLNIALLVGALIVPCYYAISFRHLRIVEWRHEQQASAQSM